MLPSLTGPIDATSATLATTTTPPVRLLWESAPPEPATREPITTGRPAGFDAWRTPTGFVFTAATWGVSVSSDGTEVTVHGVRDAEHATQLAHPLANSILARLPALWGLLPWHAAALATPAGTVVISGASGAGKSTLSQRLVQRQGWRLLDDDAVAIAADAGAVWGMGGVARLWADSAAALGITGAPLAGHPAGKLAVPAAPHTEAAGPASPHPAVPAPSLLPTDAAGTVGTDTEATASAVRRPVPLAGVIHLFADPPDAARQGTDAIGSPHLSRLRGAEIVKLTGRSVLSMELRDNSWLTQRLEFSKAVAAVPNVTLRYQQSPGSVDDLAEQIAQWVTTLGHGPLG